MGIYTTLILNCKHLISYTLFIQYIFYYPKWIADQNVYIFLIYHFYIVRQKNEIYNNNNNNNKQYNIPFTQRRGCLGRILILVDLSFSKIFNLITSTCHCKHFVIYAELTLANFIVLAQWKLLYTFPFNSVNTSNLSLIELDRHEVTNLQLQHIL
jgi:hypothetical protein